MRPRLIILPILPILLATLGGCGEPVRVSVPTSHPANPDAASAPVAEPSTVLALPTGTPLATPSPRVTETPTKPEPSTPAENSAAYVCPMHPEVTSDQPGICPKCQMKLTPTAKTEE